MRPQQEIDNLLQQAIAQYAGQRPDYYGYAGECLSLAKRWVDIIRNGHLNGPMGAPPSPDGWGSGYWVNPPALISDLFDKQPYNPNADYPAGSIVVNVSTHHIMVLLHNNPGNALATVFEQNADPDGSAAHTANRDKSRIDGVLVLKVAAPVSAGPPYDVIVHFDPPKLVKVKPGSSKWGMNYDNLTAMEAHPVNTATDDTIVEVENEVHHHTGGDYYRAANDPDGWNVVDCDPYITPAAPPPPPPAPSVIKTPNVPIQKAEKYTLLTAVPSFTTQGGAQNHAGTAKVLEAGEYYVWDSKDSTKLLGTSNTKRPNPETWVNVTDNVKPVPVVVKVTPPPEPVPPKVVEVIKQAATHIPPARDYSWQKIAFFNPNRTPVRYVSTNGAPYDVYDLGLDHVLVGKLKPGMPLHIVGTFQKDNVLYGLTYDAYYTKAWPNVPMHFLKPDHLGQLWEDIQRTKLFQTIEGIFTIKPTKKR